MRRCIAELSTDFAQPFVERSKDGPASLEIVDFHDRIVGAECVDCCFSSVYVLFCSNDLVCTSHDRTDGAESACARVGGVTKVSVVCGGCYRVFSMIRR